MNRQRIFSLGLLAIFSFAACKKEEGTTEEPPLTGGKGGAATLRVTMRHHTKPIDTGTVHIKYKAKDAPTTPYDDSAKVVLDAGVPVATFSGLTKGSYYLYGFGYDPAIVNNVKGGIPYEITEEKSLDITVPVTEGD